MTEAAALSPETVMRQMKQNGVTDIVWLPDSETNWLFLLMQADPDLRLVGVTREGHACSIAAGLFAGGKKPMMLIQNTGMMESGDSIRGWLMGLKVPIVLMVGYRGYTRHGVNSDTAATYTERFLMAFGIPFYLVENDGDSDRISIALPGSRTDPGTRRCPGRRRIPRLQPLGATQHDAHGGCTKSLRAAPWRHHCHFRPRRQTLDRVVRYAPGYSLGDPAMGGHSGFGLGLALAQPRQTRRAVRFRGRYPDEPGAARHDRGTGPRRISIISFSTTKCMRPPAGNRCRTPRMPTTR